MASADHQFTPPAAPLEMTAQNLAASPEELHLIETDHQSAFLWRYALFIPVIPALFGTTLLVSGVYRWLADAGLTGLEWALLAMIGATFVWVTLSVSTVGVVVAALVMREKPSSNIAPCAAPLDVALLVPIYNESTSDVFGNAAAMLDHLALQKSTHQFSLYVLSDTQDPHIAERERYAFHILRQNTSAGIQVHYRRRAENTDKR